MFKISISYRHARLHAHHLVGCCELGVLIGVLGPQLGAGGGVGWGELGGGWVGGGVVRGDVGVGAAAGSGRRGGPGSWVGWDWEAGGPVIGRLGPWLGAADEVAGRLTRPTTTLLSPTTHPLSLPHPT